jgi:hypothetical protein
VLDCWLLESGGRLDKVVLGTKRERERERAVVIELLGGEDSATECV